MLQGFFYSIFEYLLGDVFDLHAALHENVERNARLEDGGHQKSDRGPEASGKAHR